MLFRQTNTPVHTSFIEMPGFDEFYLALLFLGHRIRRIYSNRFPNVCGGKRFADDQRAECAINGYFEEFLGHRRASCVTGKSVESNIKAETVLRSNDIFFSPLDRIRFWNYPRRSGLNCSGRRRSCNLSDRRQGTVMAGASDRGLRPKAFG